MYKLVLNELLTSWIYGLFISAAAEISSPYSGFKLSRSPKNKNAGNFLTLSDFLALTNSSSSLSGILISIEVSFLCYCIPSLNSWVSAPKVNIVDAEYVLLLH